LKLVAYSSSKILAVYVAVGPEIRAKITKNRTIYRIRTDSVRLANNVGWHCMFRCFSFTVNYQVNLSGMGVVRTVLV